MKYRLNRAVMKLHPKPLYCPLRIRKPSFKERIFKMSDQNSTRRIFKTGATHIVEDESTVNLSNEAVREILKQRYPEVANATIRDYSTEDGQRVVEFLPRPGHKG